MRCLLHWSSTANGFQQLADDELHLYLPMKTIRKLGLNDSFDIGHSIVDAIVPISRTGDTRNAGSHNTIQSKN